MPTEEELLRRLMNEPLSELGDIPDPPPMDDADDPSPLGRDEFESSAGEPDGPKPPSLDSGEDTGESMQTMIREVRDAVFRMDDNLAKLAEGL